ncbi:hypothetical protein AWB80_01225 [Caballeronia pedi]|uniref:Uncharacterized protein n=1 Tax=Caballeronia pedi TaxID=1777141 RepID=A0A157ZSL7_9BURK|nr:hypothetical protein [Caballeronia pedi]SAK48466.1 hypothetical protein AWB80_01225 [Caballeronia pedi]
MSEVLFAPWVGEKYEGEGFSGLRVLVVSESHYGPEKHERPTVTPETIKALAQAKRHPEVAARTKLHAHYGKILASMHGKESTRSFTMLSRRDFWDRVAYYNFFQVTLRKARIAPPASSWAVADRALDHVLDVLKPDLMLVYSKRVGQRLAKRTLAVPMAWVHHPSSGFTYRGSNPRIASALAAAVGGQPVRLAVGAELNVDFVLWSQVSREATPYHGGRLDPERKAEELARWALEMQCARKRISDMLSNTPSL